MVNATSRPKTGAIAEFTTESGGIYYLQLAYKDPEFGELVRVLRPPSGQVAGSLQDVAASKELFLVYFPFGASVRKHLVSLLGEQPLPSDFKTPPPMRRPAARAPDGKVRTWWVSNAHQEQLVEELDAGTRELSLAVVWNLEFLKQRLEEGWRPNQEG